MLSLLYRLLARWHEQDEVTTDMIGTFEAGRAEARGRGTVRYLLFGVREIWGVLGSPGQSAWRTPWRHLGGGAVAGLILGFGASYVWPMAYTSETLVLIEQPNIPSDLSPLDSGFDEATVITVARARFTRAVVEKADRFYPHLRASKNAKELRREVDRVARIEHVGNTLRVSFTYQDYPPGKDDPQHAAHLANDFVNTVIEAHRRDNSSSVMGAVEFFDTLAKAAGVTWEKLNAEVRSLRPGDSKGDRLTLDLELAHKKSTKGCGKS